MSGQLHLLLFVMPVAGGDLGIHDGHQGVHILPVTVSTISYELCTYFHRTPHCPSMLCSTKDKGCLVGHFQRSQSCKVNQDPQAGGSSNYQ